jgi:hypothetical protein
MSTTALTFAAELSREDARMPASPSNGGPQANRIFGGHIERLIGTQMGKLHLLPGTTFSSPPERGDYDSR